MAIVLVATLAAPAPVPAAAQARLTQQQALRLAFPEPGSIERRTAFLSEDQLERARRLAGPGVEITGGIVTYYVGEREGQRTGVAYFDSHVVRSLREVLMVVVGPDGRIGRIEVMKFEEPPEYEAPDGWIDQIEGQALGDPLSLRKDIVNMTGATLTSQAMVAAARRVLALHQVIGL